MSSVSSLGPFLLPHLQPHLCLLLILCIWWRTRVQGKASAPFALIKPHRRSGWVSGTTAPENSVKWVANVLWSAGVTQARFASALVFCWFFFLGAGLEVFQQPGVLLRQMCTETIFKLPVFRKLEGFFGDKKEGLSRDEMHLCTQANQEEGYNC